MRERESFLSTLGIFNGIKDRNDLSDTAIGVYIYKRRSCNEESCRVYDEMYYYFEFKQLFSYIHIQKIIFILRTPLFLIL